MPGGIVQPGQYGQSSIVPPPNNGLPYYPGNGASPYSATPANGVPVTSMTNSSGIIPPKPLPTTSFGNPATFTAAANQQASDYDKIMAQYDDIIKNTSNNPLLAGTSSFHPITPQTAQYQQSGDVTRSLSNLSDLSTTGGYSEADKENIRARDISPIRSIYANAQQNAERQRALSGGYSPNFNAVTAQMARDEANKIADVTTSANAGIAQNVASNRIAAASPYASASSSANAAKTAADQRNADIINNANMFNSQGTTQNEQFNIGTGMDAAKFNRGNILGAVQGKTSLYGTTPALANTFGNQVVQAAQLSQGQQQLNQQKQRDQFGNIIGLSH